MPVPTGKAAKAFVADTFTHSMIELQRKHNLSLSTITRYKRELRAQGYSVGNKPQTQNHFLKNKNESEFVELTHKKNNVEISRIYNVSEKAVRDAKERLRRKGVAVGDSRFPVSPLVAFDKWKSIESDKVIVLGDVHIPYHDHELLEYVVLVAQKHDIDTLVISGDFVSMDCFSKFPSIYGAEPPFEIEKNIAFEILGKLGDCFSRIVYLQGNHEKRILYRLDGQMSFGALVQNIKNVEFSEYPYCYVTSNGEKYLVCHPQEYRKVPLSLPKELASIYLCHIINGHTHHLCRGTHKSGAFHIVEGGHCCRPELVGYKSMEINTKPMWESGFTLILEGEPIILRKEACRLWMEL